MEVVTGIKCNPQDIDILVPLIFLKEKWNQLKTVMEKLGYELTDIHEHEFKKENFKVGIAFMEDLESFAEVDYKSLNVVEHDGAKYHTLSILDFQKVYNKSLKDGYRRTKNNNKDQRKLDILTQIVQTESN